MLGTALVVICGFYRLQGQEARWDYFPIIEAYDFDVRSVKKSCMHIVHPDGRLIPFDTYNLFYRDGLERSRLTSLRRIAEGA